MKKKIYIYFIAFFLLCLSASPFAKPAGGGDSAGVKSACEISGGTFTGSESGNWACCWSDWGCYGCVDGACKVNCTTQRCRDANKMKLPGKDSESVKIFAPPVKAKIILQNKKKITVKGELPAGVVIKNNKVMLKKGYSFEKVSKNRVNVISRMSGGGIKGSFDCTCNGNDGGCDVITTPTSVSCAVSTCKSSCYMITTIPGSTTQGFLYWDK